MVKLLIIAPYYEIATNLWSPFLKGWVSKELQRRKITPVLLWGDDAVREKVWNALKDSDIYGVLGVGHGNETTFTGQNYNVIVKVGDQLTEDWKRVLFGPVSCLVGQQLLPWLIQQGVPAGIGEVTEYWFVSNGAPRTGENPDEDKPMSYFLKAEYTFWFRLAEGFTAGEAFLHMLNEYERQASEAEKYDEEVAYYVRYDKEQRRFYGDSQFRLPVGGVRTTTTVTATGERRPADRMDIISVSGKVTAEDGSVPRGVVEVWVNDQHAEVPLDSNGMFTASFKFYWDRNTEKLYNVTVDYTGWMDDKSYLPSSASTEVKVQPQFIQTVLAITDVKTSRDGPLVTFTVRGRLMTSKGEPVGGKRVAVAVGNGDIYSTDAITDSEGVFNATLTKDYPTLQTSAMVIARFPGDDVYADSSDNKVVKFPPNWDVLKVWIAMAGAIAFIIAILLLL